MRDYLLVLFLVSILLASCGQSPEEIALAVDETRAAEPSPLPIQVTVIHTAVVEMPVTVEVTSLVEGWIPKMRKKAK